MKKSIVSFLVLALISITGIQAASKQSSSTTFVPETVDAQPASITFAFDQGVDGQTGVYSTNATGWFKSNFTEYGATLAIQGVALNQTKFQPSLSNESGANQGNAIYFYMIPKDGLTFTPTKVSFNTTRYGTNGGLVDASWINADGTTVSIESSGQLDSIISTLEIGSTVTLLVRRGYQTGTVEVSVYEFYI